MVADLQAERHVEQQRVQVLDRASVVRAKLEGGLNVRLHLVRGLSAFVNAETLTEGGFSQSEFQLFAQALHGRLEGLRSVQLAPSGVVRYVYPLETNRAAVGHNLLADPARREAVERAIRTRSFVLAGPVDLRQGGRGIIGRLPIFVSSGADDAGAQTFWGLAIVVLDLNPLLAEAGLLNNTNGMHFALRGKDALGADGEIFHGDAGVFSQDPEILDITLPTGTWQLAAAPAEGWPTGGHPAGWAQAIGFLAALATGLLAYLLLRAPAELREGIETATRELRESKHRYLTLFEQSPCGIVILDSESTLPIEFNALAHEILGYSGDEFAVLSAVEWMGADDSDDQRCRVEKVIAEGCEDCEVHFRSRDGDAIEVWSSTRRLALPGRSLLHIVFRDLSARRQAEEDMQEQLHFRQSLIDSIPSPVFFKDPDGVYLGCNNSFERFVGIANDEIVGKTVEDVVPADRMESHREADKRLFENLEGQQYESATLSADGTIHEVVIYKAPFFQTDGSLGGLVGTMLDITDRKRMEDALRSAAGGLSGAIGAEFFRTLVRYLATTLKLDYAFVGELGEGQDEISTVSVYACGQYGENFQYPLKGTPCAEVIGSEACVFDQGVQAQFPDDKLLADMGVESYVGTPLVDAQGKVLGILVVLHGEPLQDPDVVRSLLQIFALRAASELQRVRFEEQLRMAATVYDTTTEAIMVTDLRNQIKAVNPAFERITGFAAEEVIGEGPQILSSGRHDKAFYQGMWDALRSEGRWEGEIWNRRKSGEVYPEWLSIADIEDWDGSVTGHIAVFSDISKRKQDEEKIWQQANFDSLTNLPNRSLFLDRLARSIGEAERKSEIVVVLTLDLDRFKQINETLSHSIGDALLQAVAGRLAAAMRKGDTVSRLGGDEFGVVLSGIARPQDVEMVVRKIHQSMSRPFNVNGQELFVTSSMGVTLFPTDAQDAETLVSNADRAMYEAMDSGRNTFRFFTSEKNLRKMERVGLEQDLHWALERGEFEVYYQPIVDMKSGSVFGAETLIRWQHPQRGLIVPDLFIPLAEETGLVSEIGEWVLRTVCEQSGHLQEAGMPALHLSVNVSRYQFTHYEFESTVLQILDETKMNPAALVLEVTESAMTDDEENAIGIMRRIRDAGLRWSLDDFGTGYSSLSYLKRFPVDTLKIDRTFVRDVITDADDEALIRAIVAMAHSLKVKVVAEGIETREQRQFLEGLGCEYGQGFFFARPLEIEAFKKYVGESVARVEQRAVSAKPSPVA